MIYQSDIVEWLQNYTGPKYHAVLSDPPYGLAFMGKSWDNMAPKEFQEWVTEWGSLLLGVVYPGAIGMFFGGTRTFHRLTVGLEDAGWEIFDVCMFLYGCVDEDTEVLTPNGWTRYHKDILQQQILCYNKENDSFSWECPTYVYHYDYADTAYRVQSDTTDQLVSRNHRCLVEREGVLVFESAETAARQSEIRVPVLEGVRELRQAISNASTRGSETKSVLSRVPTGEAKNTTTAQAHERTQSNAYGLPRVRTAVLSTECLSRESDYPLLQPGVQRQGSRARVGETRMERTFGGVTRSTQSLRIKGRKKSSLERRSDIPQAQGKLCQSVYQIRALSGRVYFNGTGRRVCNGTPFSSGSGSWQTTIKDGSCTSQKSRRNRQSASKSRIICIKSRSQDLRTSRIARTDLARITPVYYQGIMWCPTVSSGAFVARRNGQIFITGNSGFPKSHDISKALDREAVIDCPHCKGAGFLIEAGPSGVDDYERVLCPECDGTGKKRGAEREAIGKRQHPTLVDDTKILELASASHGNNTWSREWNITAPATPDAHRWQGYGTALKPAYEPVILARAPRAPHTYAALAREFGTGAINIDGSRIGTGDDRTPGGKSGDTAIWTEDRSNDRLERPEGGRWPANVILDETAAAALDAQSGESGSGTYKPRSNNRTVMQFSPEHGWNQHSMNPNNANAPDDYGDVGGASRFFYTAKAAAWERTAGLSERSKHPTMKPIRLTEYLATMLLPPTPARLLVPFSGVGSEMIGAQLAGWDEIDGIEQDADYCVDAYNRIVWWSQFSSYEEAQKHYKQNKDDFGGWS